MKPTFQIDYGPIGKLYSKEQVSGTLYLAFREIPRIIRGHLELHQAAPIRALDFGCGTGVSTRYLKKLKSLFKYGLEAHGADINLDLLKLAQNDDPEGIYHPIAQGRIPMPDESYELVISTFVLFEFAGKDQMQKALEEVKRVMKKGALFIAVTGSVETYNRQNQWVSLKVDFPQNDGLKSGDLGRVDFMIGEEAITFQNYFWTKEDYQEVFQKAGLQLEETLAPLGHTEEERTLPWKWKSEKSAPPYYVFVLKRV